MANPHPHDFPERIAPAATPVEPAASSEYPLHLYVRHNLPADVEGGNYITVKNAHEKAEKLKEGYALHPVAHKDEKKEHAKAEEK